MGTVTADYVIDLANFDDLIGLDGRYRIHRDRQMGQRLHTHRGFEELFIVECGHATHDLNGRDFPIRAGDLVFVLTDDVHRFRATSPDFAIVNLSMPVGTMAQLHDRYFPGHRAPWLRDDRRSRLAEPQSNRLLALTRALRKGAATQLEIDRFLIELLATIHPAVTSAYRLPPWLSRALDEWADDEEARHDGVSGLARLAGRSREHVSRVIGQSTGKRAIDVLNEVRMEMASELLLMTDLPIAFIATEVGLPNLSHFYRVFRRNFGTTPRRFRATERRGAITPL